SRIHRRLEVYACLYESIDCIPFINDRFCHVRYFRTDGTQKRRERVAWLVQKITLERRSLLCTVFSNGNVYSSWSRWNRSNQFPFKPSRASYIVGDRSFPYYSRRIVRPYCL